MTAGKLRVAKSGWEVPSGFKCKKPMFAEYLNVNAQYDRQQRMGQVYWALSGDDVVGCMVVAMGSAGAEGRVDLGKKMGNLPVGRRRKQPCAKK